MRTTRGYHFNSRSEKPRRADSLAWLLLTDDDEHRMTIDQILRYDGKIPKEVVIEDKTTVEQMRLIQQLDEEDKQTIFRLIEKMLTNKKV